MQETIHVLTAGYKDGGVFIHIHNALDQNNCPNMKAQNSIFLDGCLN